MNTMKYRGFLGSIETSIEDDCLYGKIIHSVDLVTYEALTVGDLKKEFEAAVDDYVCTCAEVGIEPLKSFSGSLNVRIGPDLHKELALTALKKGTSINNEIKKAVEKHLRESRGSEVHNHTHNHTTKYVLLPNNESNQQGFYNTPEQTSHENQYKSCN